MMAAHQIGEHQVREVRANLRVEDSDFRLWHLADLRVMSGFGQDRTSWARGDDANDPERSAPGSWQRIGGGSPPRGRFSQPPRPRVMHEVLLARAAVKRSQGRPRAKY